jgi:hypothetical protein
MAAITWEAPAAEYVNEGTTARQWMMPNGEFVMEAGTAPPPSGAAPVLLIVT